MEGRQRRSFTDDYKRQAVDLVASSGRSIGSVAKELGVRDSVLRRWVEQRGAGREPAAARRSTTQATLPSADHAAEIATALVILCPRAVPRRGLNAQPRLPRATAAAGPLRRGPSICCSRSIDSTGSHRPCAPKYSGSIQTAIGGSEGTSILMSRRRGHERLGRPSRTLQIAFHIEQLCERPLVNGAGSHEVHCPEM